MTLQGRWGTTDDFTIIAFHLICSEPNSKLQKLLPLLKLVEKHGCLHKHFEYCSAIRQEVFAFQTNPKSLYSYIKKRDIDF